MFVRGRPLARAVALAVLLAVGALTFLPSSAPAPRPPGSATPELVASGACAGGRLPSGYNGTVRIANSTFVPVTPIDFSFYEQVASSENGGLPYAYSCEPANGSVNPTVSGKFSISILPTPVQTCGPIVGGDQFCNTTTGPFVQVAVAPALPYPTGLEPRVDRSGNSFHIVYYRDLVGVTLAPAVPLAAWSTAALDPYVATSVSSLGGPSPDPPAYSWNLTGDGWSFTAPPDGRFANLTAAPGAGVGNLSVVATLETATGTEVTAPAAASLVAIPTEVVNATIGRTEVDAGGSLTVSVNATGAAGYAYTASVSPGLGEAVVSAPCSAGPGASEPTALGCTVRVGYRGPGTAQPTVSVSNGASAARATLPAVTVVVAPFVEFAANELKGYAGRPLSVVVTAENGVGPFVRACLDPGNGSLTCGSGPGPSWRFAPTYGTPGVYTARAWVLDAAGTNVSASASVIVASPPSVSLTGPTGPVPDGVPVTLAATVVGGLVPGRSWWNVSDLASPIAVEAVPGDGRLTASFVPPAEGAVVAQVAVVDALGSRVTATLTVTVIVGPVTALTMAPSSTGPSIVAGQPDPVAWQAVDAAGELVTRYATSAEVTLSLGGGTTTRSLGWVNTSRGASLSSPIPDAYEVPASAWTNGTLDLTVFPTVAGTVYLNLTVAGSGGPPAGSSTVSVTPDVDQLRLFDPWVVESSARSSRTLWHVSDRFGNPAWGADVYVTAAFGGATATVPSPVFDNGDGASVAWVNVTAPGASAGTVTVADAAGDVLLPPVSVPAAAPPMAGSLPLVAVLPATAVGAGVGVASRRWRRDEARPVDPEEELRRLAEGREQVVAIVRERGPVDLAGLAAAWEPAPAPPDLSEWVASLLTDNSLGAVFGDDGVARFVLEPGSEEPPRVTIDEAAFERSRLARDAATDGPDDQDGSRPTRS
jgi:hypothetical protein